MYKNTGMSVCDCCKGARRRSSLESGNGFRQRRAVSACRWRCVSCTCAIVAIVYALILLGLLLYIVIKYGPTIVGAVQTANQHKGTAVLRHLSDSIPLRVEMLYVLKNSNSILSMHHESHLKVHVN